jgi:peptide/nickel transport system permease protein
MTAYVTRRLLLLVPVLIMLSILIFAIMRSIPGDPAIAILGPQATPERIEIVREELKLNDPMPVQYWTWLKGAVQGDFGESYVHHGPVIDEIKDRFPVTIQLVLMAMLLSLIVGIPSGIISAVKQNTPIDYAARVVNIFALSIPGFWLATLMLLLPSLWWEYAPPVGYVPIWEEPATNLEQFYLPAIALAAASAAAIMRIMRSAVLEVMRSDYVRTARSKGLRERTVILRHVMRNSLIPVLSVIGLQVGILLGGEVIIEQIFTLPGLGRLLIESILLSDYAVVQAIVLYLAAVVILINLLVDVLYALLDPRIKYS